MRDVSSNVTRQSYWEEFHRLREFVFELIVEVVGFSIKDILNGFLVSNNLGPDASPYHTKEEH